MQAVGGKAEHDVAGPDAAAIDHRCAIDHADDASREVVFAFAIHARHLCRLASDQGTTARATSLRKTGQNLIENLRLKAFRADVIEKEERSRAQHRDVVDAVVYEVGADRVVAIHRERDLQLGADAIHARDQHRLAHAGEVRGEEPAEAADFPEHLRAMRAFHARLDALLDEIAEVNIYARSRVGLCIFVRRFHS